MTYVVRRTYSQFSDRCFDAAGPRDQLTLAINHLNDYLRTCSDARSLRIVTNVKLRLLKCSYLLTTLQVAQWCS